MKKSVIVYGPQGCGKTRNAEALMVAYDCEQVCDDDLFHASGFKFEPDAGILYLTNDPKVLRKYPLHAVDHAVAIKGVRQQS
jgi:SpoVK/Ycf46/Vps4 family AAA+-type ATPase